MLCEQGFLNQTFSPSYYETPFSKLNPSSYIAVDFQPTGAYICNFEKKRKKELKTLYVELKRKILDYNHIPHFC